MTQETQSQAIRRKSYAKRGQRSQKMMSMRIDDENIAWLDQQPNKGRYVNDLIRQDRERHTVGASPSECPADD